MKNYKTTVCGMVTALGVYLSNQTGWQQAAGFILQAAGVLLLGLLSKDHDVR